MPARASGAACATTAVPRQIAPDGGRSVITSMARVLRRTPVAAGAATDVSAEGTCYRRAEPSTVLNPSSHIAATASCGGHIAPREAS